MTLSLRRLLPGDLRGQVAGILFVGLALSQLVAAVLYVVLLPRWEGLLRPETVATRIEMIVRLLESVEPSQRPGLVHLWSEQGFSLNYAGTAPVRSDAVGESKFRQLRTRLATKLRKNEDDVWVQSTQASPDGTRVDIGLQGGGTLQVMTSLGLEHPLGFAAQVGLGAFLVFATAALWVWLTLMVNVPLRRVAWAAEHVGLDINAPQLAEQGPAQLQRVIRAFNDMQLRLQRFLTDRTLMLAALSHDLRTPLTRLRLRVDTDRAEHEKEKMLDDIQAMESMIASSLSFIRGVDDAESHDLVDLGSLLQTACDMVSDLGGEVEYEGAARSRYRCKPVALLRAVTNVIMNAVKYGRVARVSLSRADESGFVIDVEDEGPGISNLEKCRVFEPFYRTNAARDVNSGGMGLGLAIARSVILGHGGTIDLLDRAPRGLHVRIVLPEAVG